MKRLMIAAVCLMTSGCASNTLIPTELISDISEETGKGLVTISDASVAKEAVIHKTLQKFLTMYKQAYEKSGTTITFGQVEKKVILDGKELVYTETGIANITTREMPTFNNIQLPKQPSIHPGWGTAKELGTKLIQWGFGAVIADGFFGMLSDGWANAGDNYAGPVIGSYNNSGEEQSFGGIPFYNGNYSTSEITEASALTAE